MLHTGMKLSDNESFTKKKLLKSKFSEEDSFMRVKVKAKCDIPYLPHAGISVTRPLSKVLLWITKECHCSLKCASLSRFCLPSYNTLELLRYTFPPAFNPFTSVSYQTAWLFTSSQYCCYIIVDWIRPYRTVFSSLPNPTKHSAPSTTKQPPLTIIFPALHEGSKYWCRDTCYHILLVITYYLLSHITCHHILLVTYYLLSHITCDHILLAITYYLLSHITCYHILLVVTYYLLSHITCYHILLAITYYLLSHITCYHILLAHNRL
jgi:hypothetical protein